MSTTLVSTSNHHLTRYWGGNIDEHCLQLTQMRNQCGRGVDVGPLAFITLTRTQASELAEVLTRFADDPLSLEEDEFG